MCDCENIEIGSYGNQLWVHAPGHMPKHNGYCLDRCISEEVIGLWREGVTTTGCCCGHNEQQGYIGVADEDIPRMKELGYEVAFNSSRPNDEDSFIPKSISEYVEPDTWIKPQMAGYVMECCDCGLKHEIDFKVVVEVGERLFEDTIDSSFQVMLRARRK
jgi:hypothetical protein